MKPNFNRPGPAAFVRTQKRTRQSTPKPGPARPADRRSRCGGATNRWDQSEYLDGQSGHVDGRPTGAPIAACTGAHRCGRRAPRAPRPPSATAWAHPVAVRRATPIAYRRVTQIVEVGNRLERLHRPPSARRCPPAATELRVRARGIFHPQQRRRLTRRERPCIGRLPVVDGIDGDGARIESLRARRRSGRDPSSTGDAGAHLDELVAISVGKLRHGAGPQSHRGRNRCRSRTSRSTPAAPKCRHRRRHAEPARREVPRGERDGVAVPPRLAVLYPHSTPSREVRPDPAQTNGTVAGRRRGAPAWPCPTCPIR